MKQPLLLPLAMKPDPIDIELEALKTALLDKSESGEDNFSSHISTAIQSLQAIASELKVFERELRQRCVLSKTKAVEADKSLQLALAKQDMGQVFQHSIDKTVHLRLAQAMDKQLSKIETERITLKVNLELAAKELEKP